MPDQSQTPWTDQITRVVSLASLMMGGLAAWYAIPLDRDLKRLEISAQHMAAETVRLDNALKVSGAELQRLTSARDFSMTLYQEVKAVLAKSSITPREEEAVRVLVDSLGEDPFRWRLLAALAVAANDAGVREKAEVTATFFKDEEQVQMKEQTAMNVSTAAVTTHVKPYHSMRVDLFYCTNREATTKSLALRALASRGDVAGVWRIRALPEEINGRPGYGVRTNVIRYNGDEALAAMALMKDLSVAIGVEGLRVAEIASPTPNYLSVFFCG